MPYLVITDYFFSVVTLRIMRPSLDKVFPNFFFLGEPGWLRDEYDVLEGCLNGRYLKVMAKDKRRCPQELPSAMPAFSSQY